MIPYPVSSEAKKKEQEEVSVWDLMQKAIANGKSATSISLPISYNEPMTLLQKKCEMMMLHKDYYEKGAVHEDPMMRLAIFTATIIG